MMKHLFDALPAAVQGAWCSSATELEPIVANAIHDGDLVVVKGSNASQMSLIVKALKTRYAGTAAAS
jgi:UDP-N-acetylmuramoyl-tripeptide--D-alanyl-D-alanine ligase